MGEDSIEDFFKKQQETDDRQRFQTAMTSARNTMRAVKIMIEEGDYDEAVQAIKDALGEDE